MDARVAAAAQALAAGDPLGALKRVALREDPAALALRGIAMAQLDDFERAKALLRRAARAFGAREPVAQARCVVAEAEIALASRDLGWPASTLDKARATLETHGDQANAAHAQYLEVRRCLITGRLDHADEMLSSLESAALPAAHRATHHLLVAGIALRRVHTGPARAALARAEAAAREAGVPALLEEVASAFLALETPAARLLQKGDERELLLEEVEKLVGSATVVVDACRHVVRDARTVVSLTTRPVLFALARMLAEAWPNDVSRESLIARVFRIKRIDETHRARLRVEIGRLRAAIDGLAEVQATPQGFALVPNRGVDIAVLAWPVEEEHAELLALLADGEAWSSSSLAYALGASQRTVQRALAVLAEAGKVQCYGRGRARRWISPGVAGFTTTLLLPGPLPNA